MTLYIALMRKDADSDYSVDFPDFPGCITMGSTLEEARVLAHEALAFHVAGMIDDKEAIPAPTPLDEIMADPHNHDAVGFLVDLPDKAAKAVRVNISLPEDLLDAIDAYAERNGLTRSGLMSQATRRIVEAA